jgi:PKHD-type hydroxylase
MTGPLVQGPFVAWEGALTGAEVDAITAYGDRLIHQKAEIAAGREGIDDVRITRLAWIEPNADTTMFYDRVAQIVQQFNQRFYRFALTGLENLQYTVYDGLAGGHYDWHIDYGRQSARPRKISLSIQLSDPADYDGCELHFQVDSKPAIAPRTRGTVIAFPAFFLHRVTPVRRGVRKSLVVWATGPEFR